MTPKGSSQRDKFGWKDGDVRWLKEPAKPKGMRVQLKRRAFDESQVNRDGDGQFADKPGTGKAPKVSPFPDKKGRQIAVGAQVEAMVGSFGRGTVVGLAKDGSPMVKFGDKSDPVRFASRALLVVPGEAPERPAPAPKPAAQPRPASPAVTPPQGPVGKLKHPPNERGYRSSLPETALASGADRQAVYDYAWDGRSYVEMNGALRQGKKPDAKTQASIDALTKVLGKHRLPHPVVVHRGVENSPENRKYFRDNVGKVVQDEGFVSSSLDQTAAEDFAEVFSDGQGNGIVIQMKVPAGAQGVYVGGQFDDEGGFDQQEVLLQRGGQYRIASVKNQGGWIVVEMIMERQLGD